jgi:manganese/zinc/iron transport system substrate-binding protein
VADIQSTVNFVIDNAIPVMFVESSVPPSTIEAVQEAVEAADSSVALGVRLLYSDAMGERDSFGGTYIGMIAQNVLTILQSYEMAGVALEIPAWPEALNPVPPETLLALEN